MSARLIPHTENLDLAELDKVNAAIFELSMERGLDTPRFIPDMDTARAELDRLRRPEHTKAMLKQQEANRKTSAGRIAPPRPTVTPPAPVTKPTPLPKPPPVRHIPNPKPTVTPDPKPKDSVDKGIGPAGVFETVGGVPATGLQRAINENIKLKEKTK